jgi:RNA polymerase sigma-70 factor (ECF subfamily)
MSAFMAPDPQHFRSLVETHQRMVFSLALRVTGEHGTAEEVAQDAFLELHRTLSGPEPKLTSADHIRFWLRRVTVHRATDALRRRRVRPEAAADEFLDDQPLEDATPELNAAVVRLLEELLRSLPEPQRVAIVLRYQEEMLPEEIATLLGQPVNTVKSHLQRGLQLLRKKAAITLKEYVR